MTQIQCNHPGLGPDAYVLAFSAQEALSRCPHYVLDVQVPGRPIDLDTLVGTPVTVLVRRDSGQARQFQGYATSAADHGQRQSNMIYRIEIDAWLWFLNKSSDARIFQDVTAIEVIEQVLAGYEMASFRLEVEVATPRREYCVQYNETDFDFISRLLEEEGLYYRFEHTDVAHVMVITDQQVFAPLPEPYDVLPYYPDGEEQRAIREGVQAMARTRSVTSQRVVVDDFDYLNPARTLTFDAATATATATAGDRSEWFEYSAGHRDSTRGEELARIRLEGWQATARTINGQSTAMGLRAGSAFVLALHPDPRWNHAYKIIGVNYRFVQDAPDSEGDGSTTSCMFTALDDDTVYRPLRITARPSLPGVHSATVVGPPGVEIHTDKHSRVRVHFHWDRHHRAEEDCSCWIRVSQAWAGKGWGMLALPRVGQEVLVSYLDGNLDRPVVTGAVYNADNPPPYDLPSQANLTGIVSRSFREGMPQNASQLTFDDTRGSEQVIVHAERDMDTSVERNKNVNVGQDRNTEVTKTDTFKSKTKIDTTEFSNKATGVSISRTGSSLSVTGSSISNTGSSISTTGSSIAAIGSQVTYKASDISLVGSSLSVTASAMSATGSAIRTTGISVSYTGVSMSQTGTTIKAAGSKTSSAGTESKSRGMQSKN